MSPVYSIEAHQRESARRLREQAADALDRACLPDLACHEAFELRRIAGAVAEAAHLMHAAEQIEARWRDTEMMEG